MTHHTHRAVESLSRTVCWTHCVAGPGRSCSGAAHGGVTHVDRCSCGATRSTESNGLHAVRGPWGPSREEQARIDREALASARDGERRRRARALADARRAIPAPVVVGGLTLTLGEDGIIDAVTAPPCSTQAHEARVAAALAGPGAELLTRATALRLAYLAAQA